jgi:UDP-N-acetylglucosamine 4-epimerase
MKTLITGNDGDSTTLNQLLIRHELNVMAVRAEPVEAQESIHISTSSMLTVSWINRAGSMDEQLHLNLLPSYPLLQGVKPVYCDFRAGDMRHSLADISKAATLLGYRPHYIGKGLKMAMEWHLRCWAQRSHGLVC